MQYCITLNIRCLRTDRLEVKLYIKKNAHSALNKGESQFHKPQIIR